MNEKKLPTYPETLWFKILIAPTAIIGTILGLFFMLFIDEKDKSSNEIALSIGMLIGMACQFCSLIWFSLWCFIK